MAKSHGPAGRVREGMYSFVFNLFGTQLKSHNPVYEYKYKYRVNNYVYR